MGLIKFVAALCCFWCSSVLLEMECVKEIILYCNHRWGRSTRATCSIPYQEKLRYKFCLLVTTIWAVSGKKTPSWCFALLSNFRAQVVRTCRNFLWLCLPIRSQYQMSNSQLLSIWGLYLVWRQFLRWVAMEAESHRKPGNRSLMLLRQCIPFSSEWQRWAIAVKLTEFETCGIDFIYWR